MNVNNIYTKIICFVCFISNLSQLPILLNNKIVKVIVMALWAGTLLIGLFANKKETFNKKVFYVFLYIMIFDVFLLVCEVFTGKRYLSSQLVYPVHISIFIYLIGVLFSKKCNDKDIKKIINAYIISSCIVGAYIFINFFVGVDWRNTYNYVYTSKNSISQILLTAIIFIAIYWDNKKLKIFLILGIFVLLCMLKSRATILGAIVGLIYYIFFLVKSKKKKILYIAILVSIIILICCNENINNIVVNNILFNNKSITNLNDISSGRMNHFETFFQNFGDYFLIGEGNSILESFPLNSLMSYGIIGAFPLFLILLYPLQILVKRNYFKDKLKTSLLLIYLIYIINSLFEALTPFGPGIKCYILWLILGLYIARNKSVTARNIDYEE